MLVFAIAIQPAFSKFSTTVAVYGGLKPSRIFELHVVCIFSVQNKSLCATGMQLKGLLGSNMAFFACVNAFSSLIKLKQFKNSTFLARLRLSSTSSTGVIAFEANIS